MPDSVCAAIECRAHEVARLGEFIVFFEWLVWGHLRKTTVLIQMGSNVVHVQELFGCALPAFEPVAVHRVAAVRTSQHGWLSADVPGSYGEFDCNHFVIALPIEGRPAPLLQKVLTKQKSEFRSTAREEALVAGWSLKASDTNGDCGIDTMSYHAGEPRCSPTWRRIRKELSQFMISVRTCPLWQDAFVCCQEFGGVEAAVDSKATKPSTTSKKSKRNAAEATGQASTAAIFSTPPRKVKLASSFSSTPLGPAASSLLPDAATCPKPLFIDAATVLMPTPTGPPIALTPLTPPGKMTSAGSVESIDCGDGAPPAKDSPTGSPEASAEATGRGGKRDRDAQQPASFAGWLRMQDASEQARVTHSVETFQAAEDEWNAEHLETRKKLCLGSVPRRAHECTQLRYRVAVGIAYGKWREVEGLT